MRLVAERNSASIGKTLQNERGGREENESQRHFRDDEEIPGTFGAGRIGTAVAARFQCELDIGARSVQRGPEAEEYARDERDEGAEEEHPTVQVDVLKSRHTGRRK